MSRDLGGRPCALHGELSLEDLLGQIMELARAYGLRRWGLVPVRVSIELPSGLTQVEIVPVVPIEVRGPPPPAGRDQGPEPRPLEEGCRRFYSPWPEPATYRLSEKQGKVVARLWDAWQDGEPEVDQAELLTAAESEGTRLRDLFRGAPAWGALVVPGARAGSYRLAGPPDEQE